MINSLIDLLIIHLADINYFFQGTDKDIKLALLMVVFGK